MYRRAPWVTVFCLSLNLASAAVGFDVVGLYQTAVRMNAPLDESALLWMGDRLEGPGPRIIRVDDQAGLVLHGGRTPPQGAFFEFSENSMFSATDTEIVLLSGRVRISNGGGDEAALGSPFGSFRISENSVADVEAGGQRILFFCLAGDAAFRERSDSGPVGEWIQVPAGRMVRAGTARAEVRPAPAGMLNTLEKRQMLQMRYAIHGDSFIRPPRMRWFAPRPGKIMDRNNFPVLGRVDLSEGPVQVAVNGREVDVQPSGMFSASVTGDSISVTARRTEGQTASATLLVRAGVDVTPPAIQLDDVEETTRLNQVLLRGTLSEPSVLFCAGTLVQTKDLRFSQFVNLEPGKNVIRLMAFDRSGHRADVALTLFKDARPGSAADDRREGRVGDDRRESPGYPSGGRVGDTSPPAPRMTEGNPRGTRPEGGSGTSTFSWGEGGVIFEMEPESSMSDPVDVSSEPVTLSPPSPVSMRMEGTRLRLMWPRGNSGDIGGFNVYRIDGQDPVRVASLPAPPYIADLPDTFTELLYRVSAISARSMEESALSDTIHVRKSGKP